MKERYQNPIGQKEKDDSLMNFVNRQAQEAILDPNLPESYKDYILDAAIGTLQRIAERKSAYEAGNNGDEERENTPPVIVELNEHLKKDVPENMKGFTIEGIAEKIGINKNILYEWAESDTEFTTALGRLKEVQENDPFRTETFENTQVNTMMIALVLLETKDRHYKSEDI